MENSSESADLASAFTMENHMSCFNAEYDLRNKNANLHGLVFGTPAFGPKGFDWGGAILIGIVICCIMAVVLGVTR